MHESVLNEVFIILPRRRGVTGHPLRLFPGDLIGQVFGKMQAEGKYNIGELPSAEGRETVEARRYIKRGPPKSRKWFSLAIFFGMLVLGLFLWFLFLSR